MELTRLETKFYNPNVTKYSEIFHRPGVKVALSTDDLGLKEHAFKLGIDANPSEAHILFTVNEPIVSSPGKVHVILFPINHSQE